MEKKVNSEEDPRGDERRVKGVLRTLGSGDRRKRIETETYGEANGNYKKNYPRIKSILRWSHK